MPSTPRAAPGSVLEPASASASVPGSAGAASSATTSHLRNGIQALAIPLPHLATANVAVFIRTGSAHEARALNGISHVVEHMVFKGTRERDCARINLDAEALGAEVNAHTDKDHTAFYMRGLGADAPAFVRMLADIVTQASFPEAELERERAVLLAEHTEVEEDPMSTAYGLFDRAGWGLHPAAQPVIGRRANIQRFTRDDLLGHVRRQFTGANMVVAAAGGIGAEAVLREMEAAFAGLPPGAPNIVEAPAWSGGGVRARRLAGSSQTQLALGFPLPARGGERASSLAQRGHSANGGERASGLGLSDRGAIDSTDPDTACELAAALFGEGMSSPLMAELRERRGLVYHAACAADLFDFGGQFALEAAVAPDKLDEVLRELMRLLTAQAESISAVDLERARHQLVVRAALAQERPSRRLEAAALDLFALGRVRPGEERLAQLHAVTGEQVRGVFERMLTAGVAMGIAGAVGRGVAERARESVARLLPPP